MFVYRDAKGKITDVLGSVNVADLENLKKGKPTSGEVVEVKPVEDEAEPEAAESEAEVEDEPKDEVPKAGDNKAAWVDFAVNHPDPKKRLDQEEAESWTKPDLIDEFGE